MLAISTAAQLGNFGICPIKLRWRVTKCSYPESSFFIHIGEPTAKKRNNTSLNTMGILPCKGKS